MKKITAILLAFLLISTSAFPAFATEIGYDDPTEDMPLFGEMIFPSEGEILEIFIYSLMDMSFSDLFESASEIEPIYKGAFYFALMFPMWSFVNTCEAILSK